MKASIIKIGNSQGIRSPKPIVELCGFGNEVEMEVHDHELVVKPMKHPRHDWESAFMTIAEKGVDNLLGPAGTRWVNQGWEWK